MPQNRATLDQINNYRNIKKQHISRRQPADRHRSARSDLTRLSTENKRQRRAPTLDLSKRQPRQTKKSEYARSRIARERVQIEPQVKTLTRLELNEDVIYMPVDRQDYSDKLISKIKSHIQRTGLYYVGTAILVSGMYMATMGFINELNIKQEVLAAPVSNEANQEVIEKSVEENRPNDLRGSEVRPTDAEIASYQVAPLDARVIRIPKIDVNARIKGVGETPEGAVATPKNIFDIGWYVGSDKVGKERGAAFMMGHRHGYSGPGIFYELDKLNVGDQIEIELGNGEVIKYQVVTKESYEIGSVDMVKALTAVNNEKFGLNLMTCVGDYLTDESTYSDRLLIRAEQV